jgi:aminoglycoside phosphotransferase (APT) family kinase protein
MGGQLGAVLSPPGERRLRSRFGLAGVPLQLITSGWQKLVVVAPDRVFTFPRGSRQVPMVEREAEVLPAVGLPIAPRLLGLHRDEAIWPYPFLELTRIPGRSWDTVAGSVTLEDAARCLERLGRQIARWHQVAAPLRLRQRPGYLGTPRLAGAWINAGAIAVTVDRAAQLLSPHLPDARPQVWEKALRPVAALDQATVHGELSDGQLLVDGELRITGVVDWDGLHAGHPLLDLDFGAGMYRMLPVTRRCTELRRRIWAAYVAERAVPLPPWPCVSLLWCLLDATTLVHQRDRSLWPAVLADLSAATSELA